MGLCSSSEATIEAVEEAGPSVTAATITNKEVAAKQPADDNDNDKDSNTVS
jgi:hypothetical protein